MLESNFTFKLFLCFGFCVCSCLSADEPVELTAEVQQLAIGLDFTCALTRSGDVYCWGWDQWGLTAGVFGDFNRAQRVSELTEVTQLWIKHDKACALDRRGRVWCWGSNGGNSLQTGSSKDWISRPQLVRAVDRVTHIAVLAGVVYYARIEDGTVYAWGWGSQPRTQVALPETTQSISSVGEGVCARLDSGIHACAGVSPPDGSELASPGWWYQFPRINGTQDMLTLVGGGEFRCGLKTDRTVWCWGRNDVAQTGFSPEMSPIISRPWAVNQRVTKYLQWLNEAHQVPSLRNVVEVAAGVRTVCARLQDGTVWCWGGAFVERSGARDRFVTYGDGRLDGEVCNAQMYEFPYQTAPFPCRRQPVQILGLSNVTAIAVGDRHACAALSSGGVRCWGTNERGQLGDGTTTHRATPVPVRM